MKWVNKDNIKFVRGMRRSIIAKFDNSNYWLGYGPSCTIKCEKSAIRELGKAYGSKCVEIKYAWDENDKPTEKNVIGFLDIPDDGSYIFYQNTEHGEVRYSSQQVFI